MTHNPTVTETGSENKSTGLTFLHSLYGDDPPRWLTIWTLPDKATAWFPAHDLSSAASYAQDRTTTHDVYFGVGLRQRQLDQGRGTAVNVQAVPGLYLDIDLKDDQAHKKTNLPETVSQVYDLLQHTIAVRPTYVIHTGHGLHIYWLFRELYVIEDPAARQWIARLNQRLQAAFQDAAKVHGWTIDSTFDLARVLRLPGTINHKRPEALRPVEILEADEECRYNPGELDALLPEIEEVTGEAKPFDTGAELASIDVETLDIPVWLKYLIAQGQDPTYRGKHPSRSEAHGHATEALLKAGIDPELILSLLLDARYKISERPREKGRAWLADDISRIKAKLNGHLSTGTSTAEPATDERNASANGDQPPPDDPPDEEIPIHLTDRGNALRLIQAHGKDLHYIYRWKKWLVWDGTRWIVDEGNLVEARAKHVIVGLYAAAQATITRVSKELQKGDLGEEEQNKRAKEIDSATAILKWALKSESADRLAGMLRHARSERGIPITPEQLDANPWILNCCNGTIDLKTGKLYKHHRDDLCTKRLEVDYHPRARYRHPITFLYRIMGKPKADAKGLKQELRERRQRARRLVKFLQRAVGYSLTGVTQEAVLFFMYGTGDNGKSTFSETLSALLGPYFQKAPQELLMRKDRHNTGGPSPEIARLCGARLVMASEVSEHHRLNESQVKDLTGDDTLTARGLYEAFFDFRPTHKLWMYGNHKPTITGTDHAIWKRPKLIPFTETIPKSEQIKGYREKYLMPELPGILAWAVRGCLSWQKGGLQVPEEVEAATEEYRHEMDVLAYFLDEHCVYGNPSYTARGTELHEAYLKAIDHDKEAHLGQRKFYQRLRERGFTSYIGHGNATYWRGVGFRINPNADPDNQAAHG